MIRLTANIVSVVFLLISCKHKSANTVKEEEAFKPIQKIFAKPPANFQDTLLVDFTAAVFYQPDSLQLEKIKEITEPDKFDGSNHEYFFQMRNARLSIKKDWPGLKIVEAKNIRFLLFRGKGIDTLIDINSVSDPFGLFLFQPGAKPHHTDMMNIDTELGFYLKKQD